VTAPVERPAGCAGRSAARTTAWLAGAGFVLIALSAARDYGLAFDSQYVLPYGDAVLRYLTGSGPWPLTPYVQTFELYGPLALLAAAASSLVLHDTLGLVNGLLGHHAFIVLCGGALVAVTARLGWDVAGPRAGILAALLLATSPRFFAEAQTNVVDVPATLAWTVALAAIARAVREETLRPLRVAALAFGALGAIRLPNLPLLPVVPALWLALDGEARRRAVRGFRTSSWWSLAGVCGLAVASLWLFRPLAWTSPRGELNALFEAVLVPPPLMTRGVVDVFYAGSLWRGGPRSYQPVMLAVTTPLPFLAAAVGGLVVAWWRHRSAAWLLAAWLAVTVGRHAVLGLGNYDGIRHVLDALPPLAVLGGVGGAAALETLARSVPRGPGVATAFGMLALVAPGAAAIWRLHPYPVTYYNELVGGLAGAARRFETEYSGVAYREGIDWASVRLGEQDRIWLTRDYDRALVQLDARYLGREVPLWDRGAGDDRGEGGRVFTMQILRPGPIERSPPGIDLTSFPVVYEVRRHGVALLRVREVPADVVRTLGATPPRGGARPGS
jgi:hypothetical protein